MSSHRNEKKRGRRDAEFSVSPPPPTANPPASPTGAASVLSGRSSVGSVNVVAVLLIAATMLVAMRISREFAKYYFGFYELISGLGMGGISVWAVIIRFAIPFVICSVAVLWKGVSQREATTAALITSVLLIWPTVWVPELTLEMDLYEKRFLLYLVYGLFGAAFTLVGRSGARISMYLQAHQGARRIVQEERLKLRDSIRDLIVGIIGAAIYSLIQAALT